MATARNARVVLSKLIIWRSLCQKYRKAERTDVYDQTRLQALLQAAGVLPSKQARVLRGWGIIGNNNASVPLGIDLHAILGSLSRRSFDVRASFKVQQRSGVARAVTVLAVTLRSSSPLSTEGRARCGRAPARARARRGLARGGTGAPRASNGTTEGSRRARDREHAARPRRAGDTACTREVGTCARCRLPTLK